MQIGYIFFFPAVDECSDINFRLGFPEDRAQCVLMSESEAINPAIVQLSTAIAPARTNKKQFSSSQYDQPDN